MRRRLIVSALPLLALAAYAAQSSERPLLGEGVLKPTSAETAANRSGTGVDVTIAPGPNGYPGVGIAPPNGAWDLSRYGHVEARVRNTGAKPLTVALRVDNAGNWQDNPWNTESVTLAPGEAGTVRTIFGYQYGQKKGYRLDPSKVVNLLLFTTKSDAPQSFRIESLVAGGPAHETPPVAPDDVRIAPKDGVLEGALRPEGGATADGPVATFSQDGTVRLQPKVGRWDLRSDTEVRVTLRNAGATTVSPRVRLETNGGVSDWQSAEIAPGATRQIVLPFAHPFDLDAPTTPSWITSDAVGAVAVSAPGGSKLEVRAATAADVPAKTPDWLGKRPPAAGEWTQTLDQEFDGTRLDPTVWKATGENYYDKATHWSKDDVIVKGGVARLRYEKKTGFQNDDPKRNATPYAAGYLDTYGLWAQRYGYFEARMKLPRAPGLWPAFWMMPDRGSKAGPEQWKRQDTANGGMEFDVMEHLTRWGPHRYNIAMHYDGYGKDHKALGSDKVYVEADKDGFITCGLLWTPGEAVYYCNGREVLRWKSPRVSNVPSILMFTLPSGGWDNDAVDDDRLPSDFVVDYVRVWQRKDLASPEDGRRHDP